MPKLIVMITASKYTSHYDPSDPSTVEMLSQIYGSLQNKMVDAGFINASVQVKLEDS